MAVLASAQGWNRLIRACQSNSRATWGRRAGAVGLATLVGVLVAGPRGGTETSRATRATAVTTTGIAVKPGVTAALDSPQIQALNRIDTPGLMHIVYPPTGTPPLSLAPYALPGIPLPNGGKENVVSGGGASLSAPNGDGDPGQCIYWAELNWIEPKGDHVYLNGYAAFQAISSAKSQGLRAVDTPAPGEMVVWGPGFGYGSLGHAAIVVAVNAQQKTFVVSEMNALAPWEIDYRVVADSLPDVLGFLPTGLTH